MEGSASGASFWACTAVYEYNERDRTAAKALTQAAPGIAAKKKKFEIEDLAPEVLATQLVPGGYLEIVKKEKPPSKKAPEAKIWGGFLL